MGEIRLKPRINIQDLHLNEEYNLTPSYITCASNQYTIIVATSIHNGCRRHSNRGALLQPKALTIFNWSIISSASLRFRQLRTQTLIHHILSLQQFSSSIPHPRCLRLVLFIPASIPLYQGLPDRNAWPASHRFTHTSSTGTHPRIQRRSLVRYRYRPRLRITSSASKLWQLQPCPSR